MKTIEILQYQLHAGTGTQFHAIMQEISVPLHLQHGIDVVSYGQSLHDPDSYYLIRAFDSFESMVTVLEAFYASSDWRSGPREEIIGCISNSLKSLLRLPCESVDGLRK